MGSLAHRAALVSFARLCNQAVALLSPIILVRLLPVAEFGAYRSFFLYFNIASALALTSANWSLLYFIPRQPAAMWRIVTACARIVAVSSAVAAAVFYIADLASGGRIIGERINAVLLYMILFVNLDFWEPLALAKKKPLAVLGYTVGRLLARMTAAITTAAITHDANAIIATLIGVEAVRFLLSAGVWRRMADDDPDAAGGIPVREILAQSLPVGLSVLVNTVNSQTGGIIVEKLQGEVGLAYLTVGTYVYFIVSALRNSVSDVLLPEMASAGTLSNPASLRLWQRSTVIFAIMLLPVATVLCVYAAPLIEFVFSHRYLPAVPVFQVYLLVLVRECFDFDLALRAAGQPRRALAAHIVTLIVNLGLALWLVRQLGVVGAGISMIAARAVSGVYLARCVADVVGLRLRAVFPWRDLARVVVALSLAAMMLAPAVLYPQYGWPGRIACGMAFGFTFLMLLRVFDVGEIRWLYAAIGRRLGMQHS